ncbi:uncharacterized protein N7506_007376 [Penicillium brevicompactum]|uniref:uncharacterized protein n=1 Tax=Penicillium brevicompactum TaxID=5074 RepID=UPI00253FD86A|nr:uncharacterized protein N7506_007376 [Penicillium brevicompactum]KAJ5333593.1 hypothetical protein N7506_007376 [Penicillium brevicompactum]
MPGNSTGGKKRSSLGERVSAGESLKGTAREDATWSQYRGDLKTACFGGESHLFRLALNLLLNNLLTVLGISRGGKKRSSLGERVSAGESLKETAREDATWSQYRGDLKTACFGGTSNIPQHWLRFNKQSTAVTTLWHSWREEKKQSW